MSFPSQAAIPYKLQLESDYRAHLEIGPAMVLGSECSRHYICQNISPGASCACADTFWDSQKLSGTDWACDAISSLHHIEIITTRAWWACDFVACPFISIQLCCNFKPLDARWPAKPRDAVTHSPGFYTCKRDEPATTQWDQLGSTRSNLSTERLGIVSSPMKHGKKYWSDTQLF